MKTYKNIASIALCAFISLNSLSSCEMNVTTCSNPNHPHRATVDFSYTWPDKQHLDSMFIISRRNPNDWKCGVYISSAKNSKNEYRGRYLYGAPEYVTDNSGQYFEEYNSKNKNARFSYFYYLSGTFTIHTFGVDTASFTASDKASAIFDESSKTNLYNLNLTYKTYSKTAREITKYDKWTDMNPYASYVIPLKRHIYMDSIVDKKIALSKTTHITFKPEPITQNLTIKFKINKQKTSKFIVDSIVADISGIPHRIYIANGNLDIKKTYKQMFKFGLYDSEGNSIKDKESNSAIFCKASLKLTSLIQNTNKKLLTGPGILQVLIYTKYKENGKYQYRNIMGKINLYNTISDAKLTKYSSDRTSVKINKTSATLNIANTMNIDGKSIIKNEEIGSVDAWTNCDEIYIDI